MKWYADAPALRTRQVVTDVLVVLWCLLSIRVAMATSSALGRLQEPTDRLRSAGDLLASGPGPIGDAGERLAAAGTKAHDGIGQAAFVLGLVVAGALMGWVAARWLPRRFRRAREAAAVLALHRDVDALALRAATTLPLHRLARLGPDPVARWRRESLVPPRDWPLSSARSSASVGPELRGNRRVHRHRGGSPTGEPRGRRTRQPPPSGRRAT